MQGACAWRTFREGNVSAPNDWAYGVESLLHEQLLQSEHRTLDPKEADFFYVPVYTSCFIHPVYAWADMPFFYGPGGAADRPGTRLKEDVDTSYSCVKH